MWLIIGTIPEVDFPVTFAPCNWDGQSEELFIGEHSVAINRGTPALLAAACALAASLNLEPPTALVAGDTGSGDGSRAVYAALCNCLSQPPSILPTCLTFHYLLPDIDWHSRIFMAIESLPVRPLLIADAGFMYAAKMSGYAREYDIFTPDIGELAFLADPLAPHPFYTRGFLLADEGKAEELIKEACLHNNASTYMLVKGHIDRVVKEGQILHTLDVPDLPFLEVIGGTGDTITGMLTALAVAGFPLAEACLKAARINRELGSRAKISPASGIVDLLRKLPECQDILD